MKQNKGFKNDNFREIDKPLIASKRITTGKQVVKETSYLFFL